MKIAITGSTASGKTYILKQLHTKYKCYSFDDIIYDIYDNLKFPITNYLNDILGVKAFTDDGKLDLYVMIRVLWTKDKLHNFYKILYEIASDFINKEIQKSPDDIYFIESPLLFEVDRPWDYDVIIYVDETFNIRLQRVINNNQDMKNHINPSEWLYRYENCMIDEEYKKRHSNYIIKSSINIETLIREILKLKNK